MPEFPPLRVRGGAHRLRRALRRRGRLLAAGLALVTAAVAASGARSAAGPDGGPPTGAAARGGTGAVGAAGPPVRMVSAPVRIADAETVRLLRPGDRVDVIATSGPPWEPGPGSGPGPRARAGEGPDDGADEARVVVAGVRVTSVPEPPEPSGVPADEGGGALVVLSVPRASAAELAGAAATSRLTVTVC
ncbi:RcpC/CpaB family pilus assembly protein [Streptomyces qinzhouensis]|uniref:RcpC/CpaB family pilus assembly protein n=1 Tax=Streptomyces qinzhouensis TaxID=2599401 RepID=UPI00319E2BA3